MHDEPELLALEWSYVADAMREKGLRRETEIEQFRLMFYYAARVTLLALLSPVNPTRVKRQMIDELMDFDLETAPNATLPATQGTGEPVGQDQAAAS